MATSKLQRKVAGALRKTNIQFSENTRPSWLISKRETRLELDFYSPNLSVAIEVQGEQHQKFVKFFHKNYDTFISSQQDDLDKQEICEKFGVKLFYIYDHNDIEKTISEIRSLSNDSRVVELLRFVPIGRWNKQDPQKLERGIELLTRTMKKVIDRGFSPEYLTDERIYKIKSAVVCIAVNDEDFTAARTIDADILRAAIMLASNGLNSDYI